MNRGGNTIIRPLPKGRGFLFLYERKVIMTIYDELVARGLIAQVTDEDEIKEIDHLFDKED